MERQKMQVLFGRKAPAEGYAAGYAHLLLEFELQVPTPRRLALVDGRRGRRIEGDWLLFDDSYFPGDDVYEHLVFALKYEGIDLLLLKAFFGNVGTEAVTQLLQREPTGQYTRRLWFLYEWLRGETLDLPDTDYRNYHDLVDPALQYPGPSISSRRHMIRNNLPGTRDYCPLVHRTATLDEMIALRLQSRAQELTESVPKNLVHRAAAFLLLADSRASFAIEGEQPSYSHAQNWATAIGQAGTAALSRAEFERLQQMIIPRPGAGLQMGYRKEEGFVGDRDRVTHAPLPDHISAKAEDIEGLMEGLIETAAQLERADMDPVIAAASVAFGFVFIHPFVDGNGRLHRWLIHHMLATKGFTRRGLVFPVSSVMLERMDAYRQTLEEYSRPRLPLIEWSPDERYNVSIHNDTADLYRYFDATPQAEFLYACVRETVENILPAELDLLRRHDAMKSWLEEQYEFSDATDTLLISFLARGDGTLSKRVRGKEFRDIPPADLDRIEQAYR
ncbi:MAG: Fic family protein, partial [Bacteroidota bacterium]|nr:Fic family protein [Bacteroidota bacterium]